MAPSATSCRWCTQFSSGATAPPTCRSPRSSKGASSTLSAVRHLASEYPYDAEDHEGLSLRGSTDRVSQTLRQELQERLHQAGVDVMEARLSHLAYAQEIAGAMLQRQQAAAIIAARQMIVDGAVGMVEMALERLKRNNVIELDDERKAAMVSNQLVVLCGERAATPVLNTGTLNT